MWGKVGEGGEGGDECGVGWYGGEEGRKGGREEGRKGGREEGRKGLSLRRLTD